MDRQEFLDTLKNPVRVRILRQIPKFFAGIQYYAWDLVVNTRYIEKDGCYDLYVTLSKKEYFAQVERALMNHFTPTHGDYSVVQGGADPQKEYSAPDGDVVYTKMYAIVEASNYNMPVMLFKGRQKTDPAVFYCPYIPEMINE